MIRHHDMHAVVGAPLRHVATDAVGLRPIHGGRRDWLMRHRLMAPGANLVVASRGLLIMADVMRIVASRALQFFGPAFQEALRFAKSVSHLRDLEAGVLSGLAIESDLK